MRRSGKSKPVVGTWQARFMAEGVEGLMRDKTRKPGKPRCRPPPFSGWSITVSGRSNCRRTRSLSRSSGTSSVYVDPPAHAVVLSVDEKSQIQALDRTQPGLRSNPEM